MLKLLKMAETALPAIVEKVAGSSLKLIDETMEMLHHNKPIANNVRPVWDMVHGQPAATTKTTEQLTELAVEAAQANPVRGKFWRPMTDTQATINKAYADLGLPGREMNWAAEKSLWDQNFFGQSIKSRLGPDADFTAALDRRRWQGASDFWFSPRGHSDERFIPRNSFTDALTEKYGYFALREQRASETILRSGIRGGSESPQMVLKSLGIKQTDTTLAAAKNLEVILLPEPNKSVAIKIIAREAAKESERAREVFTRSGSDFSSADRQSVMSEFALRFGQDKPISNRHFFSPAFKMTEKEIDRAKAEMERNWWKYL